MLKFKLIIVLIVVIQHLGFSQWEQKNISTASILTSVVFQNEDVGFVVGGNEIFKTEDGGDTWETVHTAPELVIYEDVLIIDNNQVVTVGFDFDINESIITKSTDSGTIWTDANVASFSALKAAFFPTPTIGYCSGGGGTILKTTDAGNTWQELNTGVFAGLNSIYFIDEMVGIAVGGTPINSTIVKTQDGGTTWTEIENPSDNNLQSIHFTSDQTAYVVGWNGEIMITENCGNTWTLQNSVSMQGNLEVLFTDDITGYIVGGDLGESIIQRTENAGILWEDISPNVQQGLVGIHFPTPSLGYAVGSFGKLRNTLSAASFRFASKKRRESIGPK